MKLFATSLTVLAGLVLAPHSLAASPLVVETRAVAAAPSAALRKPPRVVVRDLRACSKAAYHAPSFRCVRDERSRPFVSQATVCTLEVVAYAAVTLRARMEFAGGTQFTFTKRLARRTRTQIAFGIEFPATLPAGAYTCRFTVATARASATMRSVGPAGPVVWSAVCATTLLRRDGTCGLDQSAAPLFRPSSLSCSASLVGQQGRRVTVELLAEVDGVWTRVDGGDAALRRPIVPVYLSVPSPAASGFAAGRYACRYTVDGTVVGEKLFTVA
ncbi:MAG: hypothetical protein ICV64_10685 [Thermoleophilia bacterium]|nr:hypothetical protein [Thermoleophilia bacterium]